MILPNHILEKLPAAERAKLGKAGMTAAEANAAFVARNERQLQRQIHNELMRRGIWHDLDATNKRRTGTLGTPDFLFSINGRACALEVKFEGGRLRPEQEEAIRQMTANGWRVTVVRTLQDAIAFIKSEVTHESRA